MPDPLQDDKKTQNLSIYLIKDEFRNLDVLVKDGEDISKHPIHYNGSTIGHLFVQKTYPSPPRWAYLFQESIDGKEIGDVAASAAVFILKAEGKMFAITFGHGRHLLATDCWEERFGIRVTLNCIDSEKVRCIDKKTLDAITKQSREQASRDAPPSEFGLNIEQDLLRAVTGKPIEKSCGCRMSGMDSLHVAVKADLSDIPELISRYHIKYNDESYKRTFPWVDHIAEVKSKTLTGELDNLLVNEIKEGNLSRIWMAVPDLIEWEKVSGFRYTLRSNKPEYTDIHLEKFLASLRNPEEINIDTLHTSRVYCISNDGFMINKWAAYKCIYGEIIHDSDTYILSGGKWYRIDTDFVQSVNKSYAEIPKYEAYLPVYDHDSETDYNKAVADGNPGAYALMDRKIIQHGGGYSKFEFCDLYTANKDMVHVKRYGGSSVLSHLFLQGVNSAELFQTDPDFREKVNSKLPDDFKIKEIVKRPDYEEYRVVYAIISDIEGDLEIPFFSKLSLKNSRRRLEGFGYKVALAKIDVTDRVRKFTRIRKKIMKSR
ncbi:MAG: TIGR04141 family sporadically distributed protein [Candidatus Hodarchaeota archaeon]